MVRHLLALIVITTCTGLAIWQAQRLSDRKEVNALLESQTRLPTVALEGLTVEPDADTAYRHVTVRGSFDVEQEVVLQSRSFNKRPGNHLLTPLVTDSGSAVIVDRGWVPIEINGPGSTESLPPKGEVTLTGILLPSEGKSPLGVSDPPPGTVTAIPRVDLHRLEQQLPYPILSSYLRLEEQEPTAVLALPEPVPLPPLDEGPHFEYLLQWAFFALAALVIYAALLRKELRNRLKAGDPKQAKTLG